MTALDQLLAAADPAPRSTVDALTIDDAATALRDEILATEPETAAVLDRVRGRRRWPMLAGASAVLAVAVVLATATIGPVDPIHRSTPGAGEAWAASAVRLANTVPRLVVTEPGWRVKDFDQSSPEHGWMTIERGRRSVEITWMPRDEWRSRVKSDRIEANERGTATVAGEPALLFQYPRIEDHFAVWRSGDWMLEARTRPWIPPRWRNRPIPVGEGMGGPEFVTYFDAASFRSLMTSLRPASINAWLSSMPSSVVKPGDAAETIARMLEDVPTPPGFDAGRYADESVVRDPYQLGARVTKAVTCGWLTAWQDGLASSDVDLQSRAVTALSSARRWKVLQDMTKTGQFPRFVWEYTDQLARGEPQVMADNGRPWVRDFRASMNCPTRRTVRR